MRGGVAIAVIGLALAVVPFGTAAAKNACLLVKQADVSAALKAKVAAGKHAKVGPYNVCTYSSHKITVTVKTRPLSRAAFAQVIKKIPGTSLKATDISSHAWVFFTTNGQGLDDWKQGNEVDLLVDGAGANAVLIIKALGRTAHARV